MTNVPALALVGVGLFFIIAGIIIEPVADSIMKSAAKKALTVDRGVWDDEDWADFLQVDTDFSFWFWNCTNLQDVLDNGVAPILSEVGPYRYTQEERKIDVEFQQDGEHVSYLAYDTYVPVSDEEDLRARNDKLVVINPAYIGAAGVAGTEQSLMAPFAASALGLMYQQVGVDGVRAHAEANGVVMDTNTTLGVVQLFTDEDYTMAYILLLRDARAGLIPPEDALKPEVAALGFDIPSALGLVTWLFYRVPATLFGQVTLGGDRNDLGIAPANGGPFTLRSPHDILFGYADPLLTAVGAGEFDGFVTSYETEAEARVGLGDTQPNVKKTGKADFKEVLQYVKWQGNAELPVGQPWKEVESIAGSTDGSQWTPFVEGDDPNIMYVFLSEAYRTLTLFFEEDMDVFGITLRRYIVDLTHFESAATYPANDKYYMDMPTGFVPMTKVAGGAPLFLSLPHCHQCAAANKLQGQSYEEDLHQTYIGMDPFSGRTLDTRKRLQSGFRISPLFLNSGLSQFANLFNSANSDNEYFWPLLWLEQAGTVEEEDAESYKGSVYNTRDTIDAVRIALLCVGSILTVAALAFILHARRDATKATEYPDDAGTGTAGAQMSSPR